MGVTFGLAAAGIVAQTFGWRWVFAVLGAPGIVVGLLAWLTVAEPMRRGHKDLAQTAPPATGKLWTDVRQLLGQSSYRHILLAVSIGNFVANGLGQWTASFFVRVHELTIAQVGVWLGASSGVGGVVGILLGGIISVRLVARDRRWEVWLPAMASGLSLPLYFITFVHPVAAFAIGAKFLAALVAALGTGVGLASIQSVVPANMRAMGVAIIMFASAFIGMGAGPLAVGILSDYLAPHFGRFSLRYALVVTLAVSLWSILHYWLASRRFREHAGDDELETCPA